MAALQFTQHSTLRLGRVTQSRLSKATLSSDCCQAWYDRLVFSWTEAVCYTSDCELFGAQAQRVHQASAYFESFANTRSCHLRGCTINEIKSRKFSTKQQAKSGSEEGRTRQLLRARGGHFHIFGVFPCRWRSLAACWFHKAVDSAGA